MEGANNGQGFKPRILICCECKQEFVFTSEAQEYFAERGYTEDPKRCKACYTSYKKAQRNGDKQETPQVPTPDSQATG
jgi:hypothetical protein